MSWLRWRRWALAQQRPRLLLPPLAPHELNRALTPARRRLWGKPGPADGVVVIFFTRTG